MEEFNLKKEKENAANKQCSYPTLKIFLIA